MMIAKMRSTLVYASTLLILLLGSAGGSGWPVAQVHAHDAQAEAGAQGEQLTGTLHVVWGDPLPGTDDTPMTRYTLVDAQGTRTTLVLDDTMLAAHGGALALHGQQVTVTGDPVGDATLNVATLAVNTHTARTGATADAATADAATTDGARVSGPQRWVTILCRFADYATFTPHPHSYYETLMGSAAPGMDHYWREVSSNTISIDGGTVVGWYNLPRPQAAYVQADGGDNVDLLATDCAAAADRAVVFPDVVGINFIFNGTFNDARGYGSPTQFLTNDGQTRTYRTTWILDDGYLAQGVLAHEMGHAFGLPHSSGPYDLTYDSAWDLMSGQSTCAPHDDQYGCIAAHTIAYHKHLLGWIPAHQSSVVAAPGTQHVTLAQLATPVVGSDSVLVRIPINGSAAQFYTVEARRAVGYDQRIPGDAVVIHRVDTTRLDRVAQVVDGDKNGDTTDAGAMWLPGETFRDTANGITVTVDRATATGFAITITTTSTAPVCSDMAYEPDPASNPRRFAIGTTEAHALCDAHDSDWVFFAATAGTDTLLTVVGGGQYRTDDDSNGGLASVITFTAPTAGQYDVGVQQEDGRGSTSFRYDLRIMATPVPTTLQPQVWIPLARR